MNNITYEKENQPVQAPNNIACIGAFIMEGLRDTNRYGEILDKWGCGCIELVYEMTGYAEYIENEIQRRASLDVSFPGVFDYEVTNPFGRWFGEYILQNEGRAPSETEARDWLDAEISEFFARGEQNAAA